jgi:ornithine decarboxylase
MEASMTGEFGDIGIMLAALKPDEPRSAIRPHELQHTAAALVRQFPGDVAYDVRVNAHGEFLQALYAGGIRYFAVCTIEQLRAVKQHCPDAVCYFLHPVKTARAIFEAAHTYGVTHFGIDHIDELAKIIVHTAPLKPTIVVRIAVPRDLATYDPTGKFGCTVIEAAHLMRAAAAQGLGIGIGFRLGAQTPDPAAWDRALALAGSVVDTSNLQPELIDVGGGFPVAGRGKNLPPFSDYCEAIVKGLRHIRLDHPARLLCTPGRALAASGASMVVKVELRRGNHLYLNDGIHGCLGDLQIHGADAPMRVWRINGTAQPVTAPCDEFSFYGPTSDATDAIAGLFALPADIRTGDYIEIGQMGAIGESFLSAPSVIVNDPAFVF